jgi:hypothetical protein
MAARLAGRKHAEVEAIRTILVNDHHPAFERFGASEHDDRRGASRLRSEDRASKSGDGNERNAHSCPLLARSLDRWLSLNAK